MSVTDLGQIFNLEIKSTTFYELICSPGKWLNLIAIFVSGTTKSLIKRLGPFVSLVMKDLPHPSELPRRELWLCNSHGFEIFSQELSTRWTTEPFRLIAN